jgi:nicotinamide-nucleotide amidase
MKAQIITVGDEILIGQIIDTNSAFISKELIKIGIEVTKIVSIGDFKEEILSSLKQAQGIYDIVIITGGLGPTNDDVTKDAFCDFFDDKLVHNPEILNHIEKLFEKFVDNPINELNRAQAFLPSKAKLIPNLYGTAAGMSIKDNNTLFISLPGVPFEMKAMITNFIIPQIKKDYKCPIIIHKTLITYGKGESFIAKKLKDFESNIPANFKLAYLPNLGRVRLRLSAKGDEKYNLEEMMDSLISELYKILGKIIIGYETLNPIEKVIGKKLVKSKKTLSIAESLTGGLLSSRFTSLSGASYYFKGSVVAYSSSIKENILRVNPETIKKFSVVSSNVANEMALETKKILNSDYAISTTGNAGPTKGDSNKPIGKIFISIATPNDVKSFEFNFGKNREKNIHKTVNKALELLFSELLTRD